MIQNLRKFLKDIADAIRAKEGSYSLINPQDFVDRINALQIGGNTAKWPAGYYAVEFFAPGLGDGTYVYILITITEDLAEDFTWEEALANCYIGCNYNINHIFGNITINDGNVFINEHQVYHDLDGESWIPSFSNPVKSTDIIKNTTYFFDNGSLGGGV